MKTVDRIDRERAITEVMQKAVATGENIVPGITIQYNEKNSIVDFSHGRWTENNRRCKASRKDHRQILEVTNAI